MTIHLVSEAARACASHPNATSRPCAWFVDVQDGDDICRVPLVRQRMVVGSSEEADVRLRDPGVARQHLALEAFGSAVKVIDLASPGTYVGGARVDCAYATSGTVITFGESALIVGASNDVADDELPPSTPLPGVAGSSAPMRRLWHQVARLAELSAPVLITGPSGAGKELIARALHTQGLRASRPFVAINVAALPRELVESELFGHERGAFTGASSRRLGAFAEAEDGTLFLDEIGELPLEAQPKLLRALDGYEVRRVGASGSGRRSRVRIIAATHASLEQRVAEGTFRRDLFHRLEVFVLDVPPLHARLADIGPISVHILRSVQDELGHRRLSPSALARLMSHDWPGNVRELRNVLFRAAHHAGTRVLLDATDVDIALRGRERREFTLTPPLAKAVFAKHQGNLSAAARSVGYARTSFRKLLQA